MRTPYDRLKTAAAARLLFSERSMRRAVAHNTLPTDARMRDIYDACCAELGIAHKLPLQSMAGIYSPALTVSLKPMILLPANITDTLSEAQLAYALRVYALQAAGSPACLAAAPAHLRLLVQPRGVAYETGADEGYGDRLRQRGYGAAQWR